MILFQTDKQTTIADILLITGIRPNNFWFEYFMVLFGKNFVVIEDFETLVTFLQPMGDRHELIVKLKRDFDIDGQYFINMKIFALEQSSFNNIDFTKIKSRKVKIVEVNKQNG